MSNLTNEQLSVVMKAYEVLHGLAKSNGETAWNVRVWGLGIWAALMAYAFEKHAPEVELVALLTLICVGLFEAGIRQVQYGFIAKAIELESSLNDILVGRLEVRLPAGGVSSNIETPSFTSLLQQFGRKRWLNWAPYALLIGFTLVKIRIG
jgi:hypothetical protein